MSYVLGTVADAGSEAASGHEFALAESEAAGIQPRESKAGFSPWWVLGGLLFAGYVWGGRKYWPKDGASYRGQHDDDKAY